MVLKSSDGKLIYVLISTSFVVVIYYIGFESAGQTSTFHWQVRLRPIYHTGISQRLFKPGC
jgi:hypothetical protein